MMKLKLGEAQGHCKALPRPPLRFSLWVLCARCHGSAENSYLVSGLITRRLLHVFLCSASAGSPHSGPGAVLGSVMGQITVLAACPLGVWSHTPLLTCSFYHSECP